MRNPLRAAIERVERTNPFLLSHHPSCAYYDHHTFELYGADLCLGCFVVYPVGALSLATLTAARLVAPGLFDVGTLALYGVGATLVAPILLLKLVGGRRRLRVRIAAKALLAFGLAVFALPLVFRPVDRLRTFVLLAGFLVAYVGYKGWTALDDCQGCPEADDFPNCSGMDLDATGVDEWDGNE
jgi:hypothetical protein